MSFAPYDPDKHDNPNGGNDLEPPADGTHTGCTLTDAAAFTAKSSGKTFAKFVWRNTDDYEWTVLQGFSDDNDQVNAITWGVIQKLGINPVDVHDLDQLDAALKAQIGSYYDLGVKTNGKFRNTYVNGPSVGDNPKVQEQIANGSQPAAVPAGGGVPDDDDIPFTYTVA